MQLERLLRVAKLRDSMQINSVKTVDKEIMQL
jgi:hypothetical protein